MTTHTSEMISVNYLVRLHRTMAAVVNRAMVPGCPVESVEAVEVHQERPGEVYVFTSELGVARIKHHYDRPQARTGYSPGKGSCYLIFTL